MILKEFLETIDMEKICDEVEGSWLREKMDSKTLRKTYKWFRDMLCSLEAKPSEFVMIPCVFSDTFSGKITFFTDILYCRKEELKKDIPDIELPDKDPMQMEKEEAEQWIKKIEKIKYPDSYGFEFEPWEKVLGAEINRQCLEKYDQFEFASSILNEMSFNGFLRESQEERRKELEDSIREYEETAKLPAEEREKHYVSGEEVMRILQSTDERTEEEKESDKLCMCRSILWNLIQKYYAIKTYQGHII